MHVNREWGGDTAGGELVPLKKRKAALKAAL
jgi:hypothetical protein